MYFCFNGRVEHDEFRGRKVCNMQTAKRVALGQDGNYAVSRQKPATCNGFHTCLFITQGILHMHYQQEV